MGTPVTFQEVRNYLCERWGVRPDEMTPCSRLLHDLGMDGDDAEEVLSDFAMRFHVDMSSLAFSEHFGTELGAGLRWMVRKTLGGKALRKAPITIRDLVESANHGSWIGIQKHEV